MKNLIQIENRKRTLVILLDNLTQAIRFVNVADAVEDMKKQRIRIQGELDALQWILEDKVEEEPIEETDEDFSYF